jgi:hypothetical protein
MAQFILDGERLDERFFRVGRDRGLLAKVQGWVEGSVGRDRAEDSHGSEKQIVKKKRWSYEHNKVKDPLVAARMHASEGQYSIADTQRHKYRHLQISCFVICV